MSVGPKVAAVDIGAGKDAGESTWAKKANEEKRKEIAKTKSAKKKHKKTTISHGVYSPPGGGGGSTWSASKALANKYQNSGYQAGLERSHSHSSTTKKGNPINISDTKNVAGEKGERNIECDAAKKREFE